MTTPRDVIIIGSGPAGYTAAIYAARANLNPLVFEGSVTAGGALMNTTDVENFPGFPAGIQGPALMDNMRAQAEHFGATLVADDVTHVDLTGTTKTITDTEGNIHQARTVILATGSQHRHLGLPNESHLSGRGVSWCATCDGFFFRDKTIAVVGGGDSALEEATFLTKFATKVYLIHRRDRLRASKAMQERAKADPKITFLYNTEITALHGTDTLTGIEARKTVRDHRGRRPRTDLTLDGLFIAVGHDPRSDLVKGQVALDDNGYVLTQSPTTHTSVTGVFACGDLVDHTYRQAITAAGSGCAAALDAERYLAASPT